MKQDYSRLSPADFEDLVREIVGRELGVRFEAFAAGPDEGIDGRHAVGEFAIILQAKHYSASGFNALKSAMRRERAAIDRLNPSRYVLATSCPLTPANKRVLASIIGPALKAESDIFSANDLDASLVRNPDIEKANIKLWLAGSAVLERVLRAAHFQFNAMTKAEIEAKVRVYAPNPSFGAAKEKLEQQHVLIVAGPPGVGKTTPAEMLTLAYMAEEWQLVAIRGLDDGLAAIDDTKKQIFFFDDFLGRVALDKKSLAHKDSELARLIARVRKSTNARFILTTRAYIFEEAKRASEHLADQRLDISRFLLDVGQYTRRIRARIVYNHLLVSGTPQAHINALVSGKALKKIVDHRHYNPRIIEWMTDRSRITDIGADQYEARFLGLLDNPEQLWDIAFRTHISFASRTLLISMFFGSEYQVSIDDLRIAFESLHPALCAKYGEAFDPKDFEESLRILEGSFLTLNGDHASFVNPSLRDYLGRYLADFPLVLVAARSAVLTDWAERIWKHARKLDLEGNQRAELAQAFVPIAERLLTLPVFLKVRGPYGFSRSWAGISNTSRIRHLLEWWQASGETRFLELALMLADSPIDGFDSWRDGSDLIELIAEIAEGDYFYELPIAEELSERLEEGALNMIRGGMPMDELETVSNAAEERSRLISGRIAGALNDAVREEVSNTRIAIEDINSESTLDDHIATLTKLAGRAAVPKDELDKAVRVIRDRIEMVAEQAAESDEPSVRGPVPEVDRFDDDDLKNLFMPLLRDVDGS